MYRNPAIGFIGFGEAGSHIAKGLRSEGLDRLLAFDIRDVHERAARHRVTVVDTPAALAQSSDILISAVTANSALDAAAAIGPFLSPEKLYADINSVSPAQKQQIGSVILQSGAVSAIECLHYALNLPTSVVITGIDSQNILDQAFDAAGRFRSLTREAVAALLAKTESAAARGQFELFKTTSVFDATSSGDDATVAPRSASGCTAAALVSKITSECPASSSRDAIGPPMRPTPTKPRSATKTPYR